MQVIKPTVFCRADIRRLIEAGNMRHISRDSGLSYGTIRNAKREDRTISLDTAETLTEYFSKTLPQVENVA